MNHHIFIALATLIFYMILKQYNNNNNNKKRLNKRNVKTSNLIYVIFLPCTLYLFKYMYCNNILSNIKTAEHTDSIMSKPYPDSLSTI
jgi:hypothetical protein